MTGSEYQGLAARTINKKLTLLGQRNHALFGLVGEVGELYSLYQKEYQGHGEPDRDHVLKEVGDCLWMIAEFLTSQGFSLDDCMETNIEKLKKRYPEGFDAEHSLHRAEGDI
jgi:NTP pyrophosphatase (non-canonical NTP hydrolase)